MTNEKFTPEIVKLAERLYPLLVVWCNGSKEAMTHDSLYHCYNEAVTISDKFTRRQMRKAFKAMLRVLNHPVISCSRGVFVATEQSDIDGFAATERSRAKESFGNATAAERVSPERVRDEGFFSFVNEGK